MDGVMLVRGVCGRGVEVSGLAWWRESRGARRVLWVFDGLSFQASAPGLPEEALQVTTSLHLPGNRHLLIRGSGTQAAPEANNRPRYRCCGGERQCKRNRTTESWLYPWWLNADGLGRECKKCTRGRLS